MKEERELRGIIKYLVAVSLIVGLAVFVFVLLKFRTDSVYDIAMAAFIVIYLVTVIIAYFRVKPILNSSLLDYSVKKGQIQRELLYEFSVPYALLDTDGKLMWGNRKFRELIGVTEKKNLRRRVDDYFNKIDMSFLDILERKDETDITLVYEERSYSVLFKRVNVAEAWNEGDDAVDGDDDILIAMYMFDTTELNRYIRENHDQKLIAGLLYIDNYDEVMNSMEDVKQTVLTALIDRKINMYLTNIDAITKRLENDKYFFVFRQKYMDTLMKDKFSILQEIKNINAGNEIRATLSIGIGQGYEKFTDAFEAAKVAIGLSLGRGGDQVAIKNGDLISYVGGKSAGTEKTTRVKARVKAQAFEELLENKDKVLIMAHQRPDADAFGSAVGIYRLVTTLGKKAYIILNQITDTIEPIVSTFTSNSIYEDMLINNEQALQMVTKSTLLVVCDVNRPSMTECEELIGKVSNLVVFDHHRQSNEAITNATLSYIEPFASSACEMITEMFQYISVKPKIRPVEADAMYMGILIDTDNFLNKTGVRTFEAASYLRNSGADITRVRKMMRSRLSDMKDRAQGISNAEIYRDVYALSYVEAEPDEKSAPTVAAAKVANELLGVENVRASFVVTEKDGILYVSARSIGDVNVQVIMERWSGGGHANIAGAQLKDKSREAFFAELKAVLSEMEMGGDI
ncbi:MAG: DHH family phosphoesterase [Eubacterium sp.]|nr:DHH family phosphoesterase [Eubacterium sp.]